MAELGLLVTTTKRFGSIWRCWRRERLVRARWFLPQIVSKMVLRVAGRHLGRSGRFEVIFGSMRPGSALIY